MRILILAAASALAIAACSKPADTAATGENSIAPPAADAAGAMAGHDMANMPADSAMPAADDAALTETPDNFMFHVLQGTKIEKVVLPAADGATWTPDKPNSDLYTLQDTTTTKLADGTDAQVFTFEMLKPGNATLVFSKHAADKPDAAEASRTVNFMIH